MKVSQFQKDRNEQARTEFELVLSMKVRFVCFALSTADIVAMQVSQFQKDSDEQARYEFELVIFMNVRISALYTDDIVEIKVNQFQKDRDEVRIRTCYLYECADFWFVYR